LLADQDRRAVAIHQALIGRTVEVLAEGRSLRDASRWSGRTRSNKIVVMEPPAGMKAGDLIRARVDRFTAQTLYATVALTAEARGGAAGSGKQEEALNV
jgi:tRNA-2-methylthio-N6-dimethylallyladenosine synthase